MNSPLSTHHTADTAETADTATGAGRNPTPRAQRVRRGLAGAAAATLVLAPACSDDDDADGPEVGIDVEDIDEAGEELVDIDDSEVGELAGEDVVLSGRLGRIDDRSSFILSGGAVSEVYVISSSPLPDDAVPGDLLRVEGLVRQLDVATFDDDFGLAYNPPIYDPYNDQYVVAATDVVLVSGDAEGPMAAANARLDGLNGSGVEGDVLVVLDGSTASVTASWEDSSADLPHAIHLHVAEGADSVCPTSDDDADGDGILTTAEGVPAYGPVRVALTVDGDTTPDSGLALDRFPVAGPDGSVAYERDVELPTDLAEELRGRTVAVVVHGLDLDDSGAYDGDRESSLDPGVPLEATVPVACGTMTLR